MSVRLAPIRSEMRPNRMVNGIATMFKASTSAMVTVVLMRITEVRKADAMPFTVLMPSKKRRYPIRKVKKTRNLRI